MLALIPRLFSRKVGQQKPSAAYAATRTLRFEDLEVRQVLSHSTIAPENTPPATEGDSQSTDFGEQIASAMQASLLTQAQLREPIPIEIDEIQVNAAGDQLSISGSLAGESFSVNTTLTGLFTPSVDPGVCGILNLELGPIHLDILGLNLDTSEICLNITAQEGSGNLLGNLLCDVVGSLPGPTSLADLLSGGLVPAEQLQIGLNDVVQQSLTELLTSIPTASQPTGTPAAGECPILDLSVGPVHLDLLGLVVDLDNCDDGPVTVSLTAVQGPGNLLGNLLCGVTHILDGEDITSLIDISNVFLIGDNLVSITGQFAGQTFNRVTSLTGVFQPPAAGEECGILTLELGELHLDLLGLKVDTSQICLDLAAVPGSGQLLGNLLCDITQALDAPASLHDLIDGPAGTLRDNAVQLVGQLDELLDGVFASLFNQGIAASGADGVINFDQEGDCQILDLSLGPVDLNLLGLTVNLDDCNDGPVLLSVSAEEGPGNLLGNLLCAVTHLLDEPVVVPELSLPIEIDRVKITGNRIELRGTIAGEPFRVSTTFSGEFTPSDEAGVCGILTLELAPIHLDVLGLTLDTSEICLNITAEEGPGNLLGNLLCEVADTLDGPISARDLLRTNVVPRGQLRNALQNVVGEALTHLLQSVPTDLSLPGDDPSGETCPILDLSLGPVDLNVLGLDVELDDCDDGPVIVNLAAVEGPGNLLGNLLCSIAGLINPLGPVNLGEELADLVDITDIDQLGGDFVRLGGTIAGEAVDAVTTLIGTLQPPAAGEECGILSLEIGEIHLDLLGLHLDTSPICLDISAVPGDNSLLGNLLCDITSALDQPLSLRDLLGGAIPALQEQVHELFTELRSLLSSAIGTLLTDGARSTTSVAPTDGNICPILDLSLGPVDLNLLGLHVHLDDCNDGPVIVSLSAEEGPGNLVGNLLCGLTGLLDANQPHIIAAALSAGSQPLVRVFDAETGDQLLEFLAYAQTFTGGVNVATGDITGDGVPDIITGPGPGMGPEVRVFDGVTGEPLEGRLGSFFAFAPAFTGGVSVASGDVDGDGRDDIIVGANGGGGPHVRVFSGVDGHRIMNFFAYANNFTGGVVVASGDINGDGHDDVIVGPNRGAQQVKVFSGDDGSLLRSFFAYSPSFGGGVNLASGDVNADGHDDIITGAGRDGGPQVRVFDGDTGTRLASFFAFANTFTGGVRVGSVDVDGDGLDDIVAAAGPGSIGPQVKVFSGEDFSSLDSFLAFDSTTTTGITVGAAPNGMASAALMLAGNARPSSIQAESLTAGQLDLIRLAAIGLWQDDSLSDVRFEIVDLPGKFLGRTRGSTIQIDRNAAGRGWFVDETPETSDDLDPDRVDLLTVVLHELGHVLGLNHKDSPLMQEKLSVGVRHLPDDADLG